MSSRTILKISKLESLFKEESRLLSLTATYYKRQAGKYKTTPDRSQMLTYEMAMKPQHIGVRKAWLTWHSQNLEEFGTKRPQTVAQDEMIRRFLRGFFPEYMSFRATQMVIKRRGNLLHVAGILHYSNTFHPGKIYWMHGFAEEFLSILLKQPVKLEIQFVSSRESLAYNYI